MDTSTSEGEIDHWMPVAIEMTENGLSTREIASELGLSQSTVARRLRGNLNRAQAHQHQQRLSPYQEDSLVEWVLAEEISGRAPTKSKIRQVATEIVFNQGDAQPVGKHWVDSFIYRHPEIQTKISRLVAPERINAMSDRARLTQFYTCLNNLITRYDVKPSNLANMDETGFQESESGSGTVVGHSRSRRSRVAKSGSTTWVTILEYIRLSGPGSPAFCYKGANV